MTIRLFEASGHQSPTRRSRRSPWGSARYCSRADSRPRNRPSLPPPGTSRSSASASCPWSAKPAGVMVRGGWLPRETLADMLADTRARGVS